MAEACLQRGYRYAAVTDHSYGLKIAGGMSMAEAADQRRAIDDVNAHVGARLLARRSPSRLAVESDIRASSVTPRTVTSSLPDAQRRELDLRDQMVGDTEQPYRYARRTTERRLQLDLQGVHSRDEALFAVDRLRTRP